MEMQGEQIAQYRPVCVGHVCAYIVYVYVYTYTCTHARTHSIYVGVFVHLICWVNGPVCIWSLDLVLF